MREYAYIGKQFIPLEEAKIGIMTNFMHYGTAAFEGMPPKNRPTFSA